MPGGARPGAGRPKGSHDTAKKVRIAFDRAVENLKKEGGGISDLSDILQEMITQDPFRAFDVLAKFTPKEMMVEADVEETIRYISGEAMTEEEWTEQYADGKPIILN